jgi:aspartate-semialdehyde dehydrogenase
MDNQNEKIPIAILGATGTVGQRFIQLLFDHSWFEITALCGSERSAGQKYGDVCQWQLEGCIPPSIAEMVVGSPEPPLPARLIFSALPSSVAKEIEPIFAKDGYVLCSNASAYRQDPNVPLIIPEINPEHLGVIKGQRKYKGWKGLIVTSPNCTTTGVVMPLKPLDQAFGLKSVIAVSMQAVSGAGYPGLSYLDIIDNVIPYIRGEEEKIEQETRLLLGKMEGKSRVQSEVVVSAQCNRVPVLDGHTACLSVELSEKPGVEELVQVLKDFRSPPTVKPLPSMPEYPIIVREEPDRPQPRRDRNAMEGMAVSVGRIRPCNLFDFRMVSVVHNTLRGAASGAILNAELLVSEGYLS